MAILRTTSTSWTGLAADTKPTTAVPTGSTFLETDTGLIYYWNGTAWTLTANTSLPTYIVYQDSTDSKFKVKSGSRGQIDGSYTNPEDAFNLAIDAGNNAFIQIRPGVYTFSAGFTGLHALGINTVVDATRAAINVPAGYTGSVWTVNPSSTALIGSGVIGGKYSQSAGSNPRLWTCIDLHSLLFAAQINGCFFRDMEITNCGKGIALRTDWDSTNGGGINGNIFEGIRLTTTNIGVSFEHTGTYTDGLTGSNRNRFDKVLYQGFTSSTWGVKDVNGRDNEFIGCGAWDLAAFAPSAVSMNITANAKYTFLNGGFLDQDNFADLGIETRWNTEFRGSKITGTIVGDTGITNANSPYTPLLTSTVIRANATSGNITINLPTAVGIAGRFYKIYRTDIVASTNIVTLDGNSTETIDGSLTYKIFPGEWIHIESDGANWQVIARPTPTLNGYYNRKNVTNISWCAGFSMSTATPLLTSTTSPALNTLWALPLVVAKTTKFDKIQFRITTVSTAGHSRAGIYYDNGNCYPGALIFDTGSIDTTGAAQIYDTTITSSLQVFQPGLYWLAYEQDTSTGQMLILSTNTNIINVMGMSLGPSATAYHYSGAHIFGSLPDPFTPGFSAQNQASAVGTPIPAIMLHTI